MSVKDSNAAILLTAPGALAGLELPDEEPLIFGDPEAGTLLMQTEPAMGCECPCGCLRRAG